MERDSKVILKVSYHVVYFSDLMRKAMHLHVYHTTLEVVFNCHDTARWLFI